MRDRRNIDSRRIPLSIRMVVVTGLILVIVQVSQAQITTSITPTPGTFEQGNLGTLVDAPRVEGANTVHDITGGTRPGGGDNLFHSFDQLNVGNNNVANFLNETSLPTDNILSRVTGGDPSNIFGTIQTTGFPGANLFLLNPAGVVFGPNASLNVEGAFYTSTADLIQLGQDGFFYANLDGGTSVLTMDPPKAFGFLGENPPMLAAGSTAAILVEGLEVRNGDPVALVGRDAMAADRLVEGVAITGGTLQNPGGSVKIASVGGSQLPGVQRVSVDIDTLDAQAFNSQSEVVQDSVQLGGIKLSQGAHIDTSGEEGGTVMVRGGVLMLEGSQISANTTGSSSGPLGSEPGVGIDIQVSQGLLLNGAILQANVLGGSRDGKGITLKAGKRMEIRNFSFVRTQALAGSGSAGDINLQADTVLSPQLGFILSTALPTSTGNTGDIFVEAKGLQLEDTAAIGTPTFGAGRSGNIQVSVKGGEVVLSNAAISANTLGDGSSGNIQLTAHNVQLTDNANIQASSTGLGSPGDVTLMLTGNLDVREGASVGASSVTAPGGEVTITAQDIFITGISDSTDPRVADFTGLTTFTGVGQGGDINITADNLHVADKGLISSATSGPGNAGSVNINLTDNLFVSNQGGIISDASDLGDGGNINVGAHRTPVKISLTQNGFIAAESTSTGNDAGNAGDIELTAVDTILLDGASITTEAANASGGIIKLTAEELIRLNDSTIASSVQGDANTAGGDINLDPDFIILQNSQILAQAVAGRGGNITLIANDAVLVDSFSTLDASSALGISGSVNIQAPTKFLSGAIVPLEQQPVNVATLYGARCAAGAGGHFSTFVDSKTDSLSPTPGMFLASPLLSPSAQTVASASSPVVLTASIAPLVLGHAGAPTTVCP